MNFSSIFLLISFYICGRVCGKILIFVGGLFSQLWEGCFFTFVGVYTFVGLSGDTSVACG